MTEAAANALLKMLEEPPAGMVFLLTSESPSVLLPTVVSRARVLRLSRVGRQELLPLLEGVLEDDAHFILRLAQGAPGIVCTLRDDPEALRVQRLTYAKALSFWESNSLMERLQLLTPLHARTQEAQEFLLHLALALRERRPENFQLPATALLSLTSGLRTNAQRRLLTQQFALAVSDSHP
jgi:DNA polymerase-3 subunit delta'